MMVSPAYVKKMIGVRGEEDDDVLVPFGGGADGNDLIEADVFGVVTELLL